MKFRSLKTLRNQIRRMRARKHPYTWEFICERLTILTEQGTGDTGLAHDIAFKVVNHHGEELPYYPSPDVARRIGVRPVCLGCRRPIRAVTNPEEHRHEEYIYIKWWKGISPEWRRELIKQIYEKYNT